LKGTVDWKEGYGVPGILFFPAIAVEILFPILIIIGYKTRIAAGALFLFCLITAFIFHF
jgi:DoxX.